ncbi:MAG: NAD-dependent epimerase/dehydratase family protein [Myxococcaceae bacterium]
MKVLLTGASGYIGSAVADALKRAGHSVVGLARSSDAERKCKEHGIIPTRGDLTDPVSVAIAARNVDAVIWTATTNDAAVDTAAVAAALDSVSGAGKSFIYTSGVWVHGNTNDKVLDENAPLKPIQLVEWRPEVEQRVLRTQGLRGMVIRPGIVYGRGAGIPAMLVASGRDHGIVQFVGDGENRWPVVHVEDLADLYVLALEKGSTGSVFLGVADAPVKVRDIAEAASEAAGVAGKVAAWPLEQARQKLGPFADALALDQQFSSQRAQDLLGWNPSRPGILEELRAGSYVGKKAG